MKNNSLDSDEFDPDATEVVHASTVILKEGKPRLVAFKQFRVGQVAMASNSGRKISQKGVVVSTSDGSGTKSYRSKVSTGSANNGPHEVHDSSPSFRNGIHYVNTRSASDTMASRRTSQAKSTSPASATSAIFFDTPHPPPKSEAASLHVKANQPFTWAPPFPIPPSHPDLHALLEDGRPLPSWLKFEQLDGEFWGLWYPGSKSRRNDDPMTVVVKAGGAEVGRFKVVVENN